MSRQQDALEHLRVIRSLMEKAHVYRAISAPAALLGGALALGTSAWQAGVAWESRATLSTPSFLTVWLSILVLTSLMNGLLLSREARRRGQPLVSAGMRMAIRALVAPMLVGGVVGISLIVFLHNQVLAALIWILCYGLALLATASFSPPSLLRLGWAFVISGLILFVAWAANSDLRMLPSDEGPAALAMGLTFGLLHLIYGIAVLSRQSPPPLYAE